MSEETNLKVLSIVENIKISQDSANKTSVATNAVTKKKQKKNPTAEMRGKPKSGRFWKTAKDKFSTVNKTSGVHQKYEKKRSLRLELQRTKELSKQVQEEIKQKELQRKERRRENLKRTEENKRKAEVVQVITNTAKLKRLRKKQLRFIEKRDTAKVE